MSLLFCEGVDRGGESSPGPIACMKPPGLTYIPDFITEDEERSLIEHIERLQFREVRMHGVVARRMVIHYGFDYEYETYRIRPAEDVPQWLEWLVSRCAAAASLERERLRQLMIARYPPGAAIGWHRDAPMFGSPVIGVSLNSWCAMQFRRTIGGTVEKHVQRLDPRSLYLLDGAARTQWQHAIPKTPELRYSITMRTLRRTKTAAPLA